MTIEIININDLKPSQIYDIYIDRRSALGNPFILKDESQRDLVCDKYYEWFNHKLKQKDEKVMFNLDVLRDIHRVYGKLRLFCWCAPKRCHGETIKNYILDPSWPRQ
ncbi:MAG: DUF4326 domain-containing protein [candidate division Zixibacteria bacterium]|nr:DUF4326 domain-containing protein [candidate division Zixibacteria bacterium]